MNFLEAITELQKPENIKTKCIRPAGWGDCYDHYIMAEIIEGRGLVLCYEPEYYDRYESDPFYIPNRINILTGEWVMCDIPALPENEYEDEQ